MEHELTVKGANSMTALHWCCTGLMCVVLARAGVSQNPSGAATTGAQRSQERITHEVRHELVMLPQLSIFDNLQYKVDGSNVTLMGQVVNAVLKSSAESAVKSIEGVENVNNQIEVLPPSSKQSGWKQCYFDGTGGQRGVKKFG